MALMKCADCGQEVSDAASACVKCGRPRDSAAPTGTWREAWSATTRAKTPINVFALAMMACAAVFGVSATFLKEDPLLAFTYSLHTFLAVSGMFFVTLLFCRKAIYHPDDLARSKDHNVDLGPDRPVLAAILMGVMFFAYGIYQGFVAPDQLQKSQQSSSSSPNP